MTLKSAGYTHYYGNSSALLNRLSWLRQDSSYLNSAVSTDTARFLILNNLNPLCIDSGNAEEGAKLATVGYKLVASYIGENPFKQPEDHKQIDLATEDAKPALLYLGVQESGAGTLQEKAGGEGDKTHHPDGPAWFAIDGSKLDKLREAAIEEHGGKATFLDLRAGVSKLPGPESGVAAEARALIGMPFARVSFLYR